MPRLRWLYWVALFGLIEYGHTIGFKGISGDYCKTRTPTCCSDRNDDCTVPILGNHLCYCDVFCDRGSRGNDCCPDFEAICMDGTAQMLEPESETIGGEDQIYQIGPDNSVLPVESKEKFEYQSAVIQTSLNDCSSGTTLPVNLLFSSSKQFSTDKFFDCSGCYANGLRYNNGESVKTNCNNCFCKNDQWSCESEICMVQTTVLKELEIGGHTWSGRNYSEFWGKTLEEGVRYRLGTLFPEKSARNMNEVVIKPLELPLSFDAREKWPHYIHQIRNQGNCGSSWAFSTTATSADRLAIMSNGRLNTVLSPQQMLSCSPQKKNGCQGGHLEKAWWYIRKVGVVSEDCYEYKSGHTGKLGKCQIPRSVFFTDNGLECPSGGSDTTIYKMTPAYRISNKEEDIMTEILTNGPVQATFLVYGDFFMYRSGVYQHLESKMYDYAPKGYHSIRLIGWGIDNSSGEEVKYWLAANSWGKDWGENGYFRILRGDNHCEIESFVIAAWGRAERKMRKKPHKAKRKFKQIFN